MLPHYSPLKVAETFSVLAGLFPGRIDLGHRPRRGHRPDDDARAAARPPPGRARRLPRSSSPSCWPTSTTRFPHGHPFAPATPDAARAARDARAVAARLVAAERDLGRPSSACPTRSPTSSTARAPRSRALYRDALRRRRTGSTRRDRRRRVGARGRHRRGGRRLAASGRMAFTLLRRGPADPGPAAREGRCASCERRTRARAGRAPAHGRRHARDGARRARGRSPREYGAEEVIVVTITYDHEARRRSYELIAEAFGARGRPAPAGAATRLTRPHAGRKARPAGEAPPMIERLMAPGAFHQAPYCHAARAGQLPLPHRPDARRPGHRRVRPRRHRDRDATRAGQPRDRPRDGRLHALRRRLGPRVPHRFEDEYDAFNRIYSEYMGEFLPTRTTIGVVALAAGARVEVDLVAYRD